VDAACTGSDVYAIYSSDADYAGLVKNWVVETNGKQKLLVEISMDTREMVVTFLHK
jgi:hypothetical protein